MGREMDGPPENGLMAGIRRLFAGLAAAWRGVTGFTAALGVLVALWNHYDSLSTKLRPVEPPSRTVPAVNNQNINTGSIDEQRAKEAARLREARAEARCLEEREKAKEDALLRMHSTRRAHDLCLANYLPTLKELVNGITAKVKCAPHLDAFHDAERQYRQAAERQCKRAR